MTIFRLMTIFSRRTHKRVDEVVGILTEGRTYLVPTVKAEWLNNHGIADWPVIGPRHKDVDLGVTVSHYHIDHRFVPMSSFKHDKNTVVNESCDAPIRYEPWTCIQACVVISDIVTSISGQADLDQRYGGRQCTGSRKSGWTCPHKGIWLGSQVIVEGVIKCPGHGLRIDNKTGVVMK